MNTCKRCGAPTVQLFTSLVCSQECDLKLSVAVPDNSCEVPDKDPYKTYRVNLSYSRHVFQPTTIAFKSQFIKYVDCDFIGCRFISTYFETCKFENCDFKGATFEDCTFTDTEFSNCKDLVISGQYP
jgi:Pentapeptide repeats (9 copies)